MKSFKINSKSAIAVITAALSLSLKRKASVEERQKIIQGLQRIMFINFKKYGVHVLERDTFLFDGIMSIKAIEDTDDVQYIEEVEVDVEEIKKLRSDSEGLNELLAKLRASIEKESKPEASIDNERCDCLFCTTLDKLREDLK